MLQSFFYNILFCIAFVLYLPFFVIKLCKRGVGVTDFGERFGIFSHEKRGLLFESRQPVLVHAVSVGEVVVAINFIQRWLARDPALCFVLSVTTTTGHAMALKKLPERTHLIYSPLDFLWSVRSTLSCVNPKLLVIFEVEIWPNLIRQTKKRGCQLALVNCRMSKSSSKGYARFKWFFKPLFDSFSLICAQSRTDIDRLEQITGTRKRMLLCNTMKFDQQAPVVATNTTRQHYVDQVFGPYSLIFSAASTHPGEEEIILNVFLKLKKSYPDLKVILTPRHSERSGEVAKIIENYGVSYTLLIPPGHKFRTSRQAAQLSFKTHEPKRDVDLLLINTTGELLDFLAVSHIVYVGKSLGKNHGGHNIIEPALLAKAVVHGNHMENFQYVVDAFQEEKAALQVSSESQLYDVLYRLVEDESYRKDISIRAYGVVEKYRGATDKTIDALQQIQLTSSSIR